MRTRISILNRICPTLTHRTHTHTLVQFNATLQKLNHVMLCCCGGFLAKKEKNLQAIIIIIIIMWVFYGMCKWEFRSHPDFDSNDVTFLFSFLGREMCFFLSLGRREEFSFFPRWRACPFAFSGRVLFSLPNCSLMCHICLSSCCTLVLNLRWPIL